MAEAVGEAAEERRRAELRKAGEEYFAKVLAQSNAGKDPFEAPPPPRRERDVESILDPDLETVGAVLEGSRLFVLSALYIASQGASWVLLKGALTSLATPALLVFLHCLPPAGLLLFLHRWSGSAVDIGPLNARTLKGSLPAVAFHSLQMLTAFEALTGGSVYLVLAWTVFVPPLMQTQQHLMRSGGKLQPAGQAGVAAGVGGLALILATGRWPGLWALACLAAWGGVAAARLAWQIVRQQAQQGEPLLLGWLPEETVKDIAAAEDGLGSAQRVFYEAALPALPALLLGFALLEGRELVDHELAVPAVSGILLSMAAWGVAQVAGLMVLDRAAELRPQPRLAVGAACAGVTLLLQMMVPGVDRAGAMLGAFTAVTGSVILQLPPRTCLLAARGPLRLSQSRIVHRRRGTTVAAGVTRESFGSRVPKPAFYEGLDRPIGAPGSELHPSFALLIFGIVSLGHLHPDSFTLFKAFAIFQILHSATAVFFDDAGFDKIATVVAPAVLALWVMAPNLDPGNIALSILGTYLCRELRVVPFWPTALSLAAALYSGVGNEWITVMYAFLNVVGLVKAWRKDERLTESKAPLVALPVLCVTAFVFWKGITPLWAVSLGLGEVVRSTYGVLHRLNQSRT